MKKWTTLAIVLMLAAIAVFAVSCKEQGKGKDVKTDEKAPKADGAAKGDEAGETKMTEPKATEPGVPVLFSFETDAAVAAWEVEEDEEVSKASKISVTTEHATEGKRALKMVVTTHQWPGTFTTKPPTADWSEYKTLRIDVFAEQDCNLNLRIDDANSTSYESRFQSGSIDLVKGGNAVEIVLQDVADAISLKKIARLVLFASSVPEGTTWTYTIDNIRLEK